MTTILSPAIEVPLRTRHLCDFSIAFSRHDLVSTPLGTRFNVIVGDGQVEGERLSGRFLPGGGDWITIGSDRVARLDVRATIETDDGARILVTNTGRAWFEPAVLERYLAGELVTADEVYARSSPLFETGDERYAWLNATHTVAINQFSMSEVHYQVHEVL